MPCSLMLEGLAQTGGILVGEANDFREKVVLAKINWAKFYREVLAGQQLVYETTILSLRPEGASINGKVFARIVGHSEEKFSEKTDSAPEDTLVGEAEIFFAHLDQSRSQQVFGEDNFVFTGNLKKLLGLAKILADQSDSEEAQG